MRRSTEGESSCRSLRVLCVLCGYKAYCTFCSRAINFCAKFCSDSDQSSRALAPEFFSTLLVNSTSFCTLARTLASSLDGQRHIFLKKRRVQSKVNLDVAFLLVDPVVKLQTMDQKLYRRRPQSPLSIFRRAPTNPRKLQTCKRSLHAQVGRDEHGFFR